MTVSTGNLISHTQYNGIVQDLALYFGNGSGQNGYGQELGCSTVEEGDLITHTLMNQLFVDLSKARLHQLDTGDAEIVDDNGTDIIDPAILDQIAQGEIIGADASGQPGAELTELGKGFNDFLSIMSNIETDKDRFGVDQISIVAGLNKTQAGGWGSGGNVSRDSTVTVTFTGGRSLTNADGSAITTTGADHRRHFFNAGGAIRFYFVVNNGTAPSASKDVNWYNMLQYDKSGSCGIITFDANATNCSGTGTNSSYGNYTLDLDGTQRVAFRRDGSGNYAENKMRIRAKVVNTSTLEFVINLQEADLGDQITGGVGTGGRDGRFTPLGAAVDENVTVPIQAYVEFRKPNGTNVTVAVPNITMTNFA